MGETTGISWTDSTFNPWIGCTRVSPACDHCYAATWAKRFFAEDWGGPGTGVGFRHRTAPSNWSKPRTWNHKAQAAGRPHFVFCASLADVFDNQVDPAWRADLFALVRLTPALTWLFLTKRPQLIVRLAQDAGGLPPNVALGASMVTADEVARDAPHLVKAKELLDPAFIFVSGEPLLGDIAPALRPWMPFTGRLGIDWVITGGESGAGARPCHPAWVRNVRDLCEESGAAFHHKQWGVWAPCEGSDGEWPTDLPGFCRLRPDGTRAPDGWPMQRLTKEETGRMVDGQVWDQRPTSRVRA